MAEKLLKATHGSDKTPLKLGNLEIPCYVLENGMRVFSGRGIQNALDENKPGNSWLPSFIRKSPVFASLRGGENDILSRVNNPVKFVRPRASGSQSATNGYDVTLLIDICAAIIDTNRGGEFDDPVMVCNADIIIRAAAKVGIIALVDEATGYQYDRERFELQKILNTYVSDEILKWQLTFTDDFYKEVYRLWGLAFIPKYIQQKPSFIGKLTRKYIYELLPKGVVDKIKENTGKTEKGNWKYKWHQSLTPEVGREHLRKQIIEVTTLMSISQSKEQFDALFQQKYNMQPAQLLLEFNEVVEDEPKGFDIKLKKALEYNPK